MKMQTGTNEMASNIANLMARAVRTLVANGYHLATVRTLCKNASLLMTHRTDALGGIAKTGIILCTGTIQEAFLQQARKHSKANNYHTVVVCSEGSGVIGDFTVDEFFRILGGSIDSSRVMGDELPHIMSALGRNKLPKGFVGNADDLFEEYVKDCFQYALGERAHRYGQQRRFQSVPDGLAFGPGDIFILFDSKAYRNGFALKLDDIRRFADYVNEFNRRYRQYIGRVHSFVVVSGKFNHSARSLQNYASKMYAYCSTQLCFVAAIDLGNIVNLVKGIHADRRTIDWRRVFSSAVVSVKSVSNEIKRISLDAVIK